MPMANPSHPGRIIRRDCIEALDLTIAEAAEHIRVDEQDLVTICECRAPITADMAIRFEQAFGSTADAWVRMQAAYDLAQARASGAHADIKRIERAA